MAHLRLAVAAALVLMGCHPATTTPVPDAGSTSTGPDAGPPPAVAITATVNSTRFVTREHFLAGGEMQISGEPFAQDMGRILADYSRDHVPTNIYFDSSPFSTGGGWVDLPGFATAVESYEYSKQPMNNVGLESGAGTSLVYGPLVDVDGGGGPDAVARLATLLEQFSRYSFAYGKWVFPANTYPANNLNTDGGGKGNINPLGLGDGGANPLGWPGIWPTLHPFQSFDPTINPVSTINLYCSISSDDDPGASGALGCSDYECDYNSLHLPNRDTQVDKTITPGADGFAAWKFGLWCLNYLEIMHDSSENPVTFFDDIDGGVLDQVGTPNNQLLGDDGLGTGVGTVPGTWLGSSDIEGFQSQTFIEEMDNRAQDWISNLTTTDGVTLTGFPSIMAADSYSYTSPLQWFPGAIAVTESDAGNQFPRPSYTLSSPNSDLLDLDGLLLGYSDFYSLTDQNNSNVGGAQTYLVYFRGSPFPADDQLADGEATLHDRALGILRVAFINMDRLNTDPTTGLLVDDVTLNGTTPTRGTTVGTTSVAYSILALRTLRRTLSSQLQLYSNNTPDQAPGTTVLDTLPINYPGYSSLTFVQRVDQLLQSEGDLLYNSLTNESGQAFDGWDVSTGATLDSQDLLDSHTAAIRGLFAMFMATSDVKYRDRAMAVFNRMETVFYDPDARIFSVTPAPVNSVEFTPVRFALLESTFRDVYEIMASRPGNEALAPMIEDQVARLIKLVLNGWDDRNRNSVTDWPQECVNFVGILADGGLAPGAYPLGGMQMGERTLTGEIGTFQEHLAPGDQPIYTTDREEDCVPDIDASHLPSALADSVTFTITRTPQP